MKTDRSVAMGRPMRSLLGRYAGITLVVVSLSVLGRTWQPACAASDAEAEPRQPNIILILCDNLGYGDIQVYNPDAAQPTPRINQLAREGRTFTHAYAAAPVCTPSRAALMTGCYPRRVGLDLADPSARPVLFPVCRFGLHPDEITVAEILKAQGYRTLCIGKWHLGDQPAFLPTRQGFDEYFGIPYSDDMVANPQRNWPPLPLLEGERTIEAPVDVDTLTRRNTERAIQFIAEHRHRPFFLYFPQITPGSTPAPPADPQFQGQSSNGRWGDSVMELDWSTGQILDKLDELGLRDKTLVIWTNDNGAPAPKQRGGSNLPLKGDGYSVAEGGMRMPFIARWPGKIPAGTTCSEMITLMDMLPTLAAISGGEAPRDRRIDGHDIRPLLFGEAGAVTPYKAFYYYYVNQLQAVRSGPWKLYLPSDNQLATFGGKSRAAPGELYDLHADPREESNQFANRAEIVTRLLALADEAREDLGELDRRGAHVRPVGTVDNPTPRVITQSPEPARATAAAKQVQIVLLADEKDHGPAGNGLHDYPLWQKRWALLLGGQEASEEKQLNLVGPPSQDAKSFRGAPHVRVTTAWDWPSDEQFQTADVIVAYCYLDWTGDRLAQVRRYLDQGGGLVLIHSATWTKPEPSPEVANVIGVGGFQLYRHGPVRLDIAAPQHPICSGLPETIVLDDDETYWPPTPMMDRVTVLATSVEEQGARGSTPKNAQPMFWCYEAGRGRVFGCVPGHQAQTFDDPLFRTLVLRGIAWAAGESPCQWDALTGRRSAASGIETP